MPFDSPKPMGRGQNKILDLTWILRLNDRVSHNHCLDTKTLVLFTHCSQSAATAAAPRAFPTLAPPCGPAQKRPPARLAFQPAIAHSAQPCYLRTVRKVFGPPKSGSIPPIGSSGTPIFSGRDARQSDLPGGGAQRRSRSLEMVENSLFWVNLGHFVLDKGRVVDPIFFGRRLAAPPRWSAAFSRYTHECV